MEEEEKGQEEEEVLKGEEEEVSKEEELSPDEMKASKTGWMPREEWVEKNGGDLGWKSAGEYNRQRKLVKTVKRQQEEIANLGQDLNRMKQTYQASREFERKKAIEDYKRQHLIAIEEADGEKAEMLLDKITEETKLQEQEQQGQRQEVPQSDPVLDNWIQENPWFESDPVLQAFAISYGEKLGKAANAPRGEEFFDAVRKVVERTFPEKFEKQEKRKAPNVAKAAVKPTGKQGPSVKDIPEELRGIYNGFVDNGLDGEKILKDWAETGVL